MAEKRRESISIKSNDGAANSGELTISVLTQGERLARAGKVLAICWVLAIITAFIPVAHFVLVPLFGLAGPVAAFMKYAAEEVTENAVGICPECSKEVTIELDPADKLPKWTYCPACSKPLQLVYHTPVSNS